MILDSLQNAIDQKQLYNSMHPLFAQALDFLATAHTLPDGRYDLSGDDLFVTIGPSTMRPATDAQLEAHDKYIDIQLLMSDKETYGWAIRTQCHQVSIGYDSQKDIIFYADKPMSYINLESGQLVIFFPNDSHAPLIGQGFVRKAIAKIRCVHNY